MAAKRKPRGQRSDPVADELNAIKRLLVLQLVTSGVQASRIGTVLGVDRSVVSRMVPAQKVKKRSAKR